MKFKSPLSGFGYTCVCLVLLGCASTTPRVTEVSHRTLIRNIAAEDEALFLDDRASGIKITPQPLPPYQQREEFRVYWTPATIAMVQFQYRQVNLPNQVSEQTFAATGRRSTIFCVRGEDFVNGGTVSAWRVSLWAGTNSCLAELHSATW